MSSPAPGAVPAPPSPNPAPPASASAARRSAVESARQQWIGRLIDPSRRNNLLYFRDLRVGTLDLSSAPAEAMAALLAPGPRDADATPLSALVSDARLRDAAAASLAGIARRATMNLEERGLETLFLAIGMATWPAADEGRPACAPVLLVPMAAAQKGLRAKSWGLRRAGDVRINDVLLHALSSEHGVDIAADALLALVHGDDEGEVFDLEPVFAALRQAAVGVAGFAIQHRAVLGNFSFQKMSIVRDLRELPDALAAHDIVAGIAGDVEARGAARAHRTTIDPRGFDRAAPEDEFLVLDADSSQQQAIAATIAGQNGVISGPPGTGKSQTIANLIAELSARGKTVLFVAEKRAALEVVVNRLETIGLGHLCLDLHGADVSRAHTARQLAQSLDLVRTAAAPDVTTLHANFTDRRDRVNRHAVGMGAVTPPSGQSVHGMYGALLHLPADARVRTRFGPAVLARLDAAAVTAASRVLQELASLTDVMRRVRRDDAGDASAARSTDAADANGSGAAQRDGAEAGAASPWVGAVFTTETVARVLDLAPRLAHDRWPAIVRQLAALWAPAGLAAPSTIDEARLRLQALADAHAIAQRYRVELLGRDPASLATALAPAAGFVSRLLASLFDGSYRRALATVRADAIGPAPAAADALAAARDAASLLRTWAMSGASGVPPVLPDAAAVRVTFTAAAADVATLLSVFPGRACASLRLADVGPLLDRLAADRVTPARILRVQDLERELREAGVGDLVEELRHGGVPPEHWPAALAHAWHASLLEAAHLADPALAAFVGRHHDAIVRDFARLDRERLTATVDRVARAHAERAVAARDRWREQDDLVCREAQKRTRHLPLRTLFADAPDVLLALRPCWMASPLSVSQLLPGDRPYFDLVIFDEASQVLPEDAVTSLLRGRRAVIAGDARQLPPTTFFAAGVDDGDEDASATTGFESVLDVMSAFLEPPWTLDWHYRSRDESLIAFSNHHIYGDRLVTFPGPASGAVTWVHVPHVAGDATQIDSVTREVQRVVELVIEHARTRPAESLGVIAMGITHADRIEAALDAARLAHPDLDAFFSTERHDRCFVKNLERVQGDERDAIILSIGYGKDADGRLPYRFGPLLMQGGERRLNVAITRARKRLTLVSSFTAADLRADYPKEGVRLLRAYLEYAATARVSAAADDGNATVPRTRMDGVEQSVHDTLIARGLHVRARVGTSRRPIDLVVTHPDRPHEYLLAVEIDGPAYLDTPTARDRDRLRQQHLEALGWRFHRIWSTDWFLRRDEEVARLLAACDVARRESDAAAAAAAAALASRRVSDAADARETAHDTGDAPQVAVEPVTDVTRLPVAGAPGGDVGGEPPATPDGEDRNTVRRARGPRPAVPPGRVIGDYTPRELEAVIEWIRSDGRLLTQDEIVDEAIDVLGFSRRGRRIVDALVRAIAAVRARS